MLYEIKKVSRYKDEHRRRWFYDRDVDLLIWLEDEDDSEIFGFQLCYNYHALTWNKEIGFKHNAINTGSHYATPVLMLNGDFDNKIIADLFLEKCGDLPEWIAEFIYNKILVAPREYK
jgi:hypothetical protein